MGETTNTWDSSTGTGDFTDGSNWSLNLAPAPGQLDVIDTGEPVLEGATVDGLTVDIVSAQTQTAELDIADSTLGSGMLIEDTNSTNGQSMQIVGRVTNDGTILLNASLGGVYNGFTLNFTGNSDTLTNNGVITIASSDGLFVGNGDGGTLVNDGVINVGASRLFLDSPVVGTGTIAIDDTTLEASSSIAIGETLEFTAGDGSAISYDAGRLGLDVGGSEGTVIGFQAGDYLEFPQLTLNATGNGYDAATRVLTLSTSNGVLEITLAGTVDYTNTFTHTQTAAGFEIGTSAPPCFAAGTRIATAGGDVAVETLVPGQYVHTLNGALVPVRWVGHRRVACAAHPRPWNVRPVRIQAGAFGNGVPRRDLFLSPDHAVFVDGVLIPIRHLLNGATIAPLDSDEVTYYHVELPAHAILLAEGLPAESYLDTGNRAAFANGGAAPHLHPDFSRGVWQARGCADLIETGPIRDAVRRRLLERASALGHAMTDDPALRLLANGRAVPAARDGMAYRFRLPADANRLRLVSRASVPAHMVPDCDDRRRLGVAVSRLMLDGRHVALTDPRLGDGWHAVDRDGGEGSWRWTDGDATLALRGRHLDIEVAVIEQYWASRVVRSRRTAA